MGGYLVNFAVYTMAMTGLIFFALMVYKKFTLGTVGKTSKSKMLSVEETIAIAPRKTLYVVRAGNERFLIAGDVDKTSLISKLDINMPGENSVIVDEHKNLSVHRQTAKSVKRINSKSARKVINEVPKAVYAEDTSVDDLPVIVDFNKKSPKQENVLHNMLRKINE